MLIAFLLTALAATPELKSIQIVGRPDSGEPWSSAPIEARAEEHPEEAVIGLGREASRRVVFADPGVEPLVIDGKPVPQRDRRSWETLGQVEARWLQVEPHAWREKGLKAKNGVDTDYHSNVSVDPKTFGKWLGFDEITYFETELRPFASGAEARKVAVAIHPSAAEDDQFHGLGTMRFKVEVREPSGKVWSSPGAESVDHFGMKTDVYRASIRSDDSFVGYLSSFFLVPEVFGSAGEGADNQTDRFVGADCADVLVGALRVQGYRGVKYTNVASLPGLATLVAKPVLMDPDHGPISPITGVRVGDLIRIDYAGELTGSTPRSWDHVAALYEDRSDPNGPFKGGPDGKLDGYDRVIHMGHPHLVVEPLSDQLPARIDVLRWDPKKLGPKG